MGVALFSLLETEAALGGDAFATEVGVEWVRTETGSLGALSGAPLFLPMMVVSSVLNFSRSLSATGWGDVKVKLWPVSSPTRASFMRT